MRTKMNETGCISKKQEQAIIALISHRTIEEAARASGIGKTTIFRWLQDDVFQTAYREARGRVIRQAISQAQSACSEAIEVLREIMNSSESPASTRVSAAKAILETSMRAIETEDLIERVNRLEEKIKRRS